MLIEKQDFDADVQRDHIAGSVRRRSPGDFMSARDSHLFTVDTCNPSDLPYSFSFYRYLHNLDAACGVDLDPPYL